MKELLLKMLLPTLEEIGKTKLSELLEKLALVEGDANFATDMQGAYSLFKRLKELADQTKTPFDDIVVETVMASIEETAKAHDITLP